MNPQFYLEKLNSSEVFKKFIKENPDAYFCSGFFTIDKEGADNQRHFDFYIPGKKQMFSFKIEDGVEKVPVEMGTEKIPEPLELADGFDFEFDEIEALIFNEMQARDVKAKIQKIIISLQNADGKNMLLCTVFISMLGILKVHIDIEEKKITLFEKKSIFDMVRRVK